MLHFALISGEMKIIQQLIDFSTFVPRLLLITGTIIVNFFFSSQLRLSSFLKQHYFPKQMAKGSEFKLYFEILPYKAVSVLLIEHFIS